jgi:hypothetical protein
VPLVAFIYLVPLAGTLSREAVAAPAIKLVPVGSRTSSNPQAVDITVALPPPTTVMSNAVGTVTSVAVHSGDALKSGSTLMKVNDVQVVAYVAREPLYRDLSYGAKGPDVARLSSYLTSLHLLAAHDDGPFYSGALRIAASAFERRIGAPVDGQFHLSSIAFVPVTATRVGTVEVQPGSQAGGGTALFGALGQPTAIRFAVTGSEGETPSTDGQPLSLSNNVSRFALKSLEPSASERAALYAYLLEGATGGAITQSGTASSPTFSGAVLSDAKPQKLGVVPSSALFSSSDGTTCLFMSAKASGPYDAVTVSNPQLVTGELGEAGVSISLVGRHVVRDPLTLPHETTKRCK